MVDRGESVMQGAGYYSDHSAPQHVAAAPGFPMLERAAAGVPLEPQRTLPVVIGDFGCAGGRNELEPMAIAVDGLRGRRAEVPIAVVHADLPQNDFGSLFALVEESRDSYLTGRPNVFAFAAGRSLYGPVLPDRSLLLGWTAITVHWLSSMPVVVPDQVYANLTTGTARDALRAQSRTDWHGFLANRAREMVAGGQVVVVGGASEPNGVSGAEDLFAMVNDELVALVDNAVLRPGEYERIFYPTWNRTPEEFLEPFGSDPLGAQFAVHETSADHIDDADSYPQFARDGDAAAFAKAYTPFVRAVTEPSFFRWLDADRTAAERSAVMAEFYEGLERRIAADPAKAACKWHTFSLRVERTDRD